MKILRKILFPLSLAYGGVMLIRNYLYENEVLKSRSFSLPVITVGNLSVGGTGKSPMIEHLINLLQPKYKVATLSRGYGRKTKGYKVVNGIEKPAEVGDEPLQFKQKFPETTVAICEDRITGIEKLVEGISPDVILLDDAFQHRKVKAGYNILLTTFRDLYVEDHVLPTGNLREPVKGANRANSIVVTKSPENLTLEQQNQIRRKLNVKPHQKLFFSYILYDHKVYNENVEIPVLDLLRQEVTLVTGIANPKPLCQYLDSLNMKYTHLDFPDHHLFSSKELQQISDSGVVLTTEKDFMRLKDLSHPSIYYIPIRVGFINGASKFDQDILQFIENEK